MGIYNSHTEAEASIKELQRSGFDMKKLSIGGKDYHATSLETLRCHKHHTASDISPDPK